MPNEPILDIAHLGHLELLTPKFEQSRKFFIDVMGMTQSGEKGDSVYLRGWDDYERYSLKLTASKTSGMAHVAFRTRTPQALERRAAALKGSGFDVGWSDGDLGHGKTYRLQGSRRPRDRALLRHRMVRPAARSETGAEEPGAALSGARLQRAAHRPLQRARRRHQGQPRILREISRLPAHRADRARRRQRSRPVDDRHQQVLRLRLYARPHRQPRAASTTSPMRSTAAKTCCAPPTFSWRTACSSRPVRTSTPFSRPSSSTSTSPAATAWKWPAPARGWCWRRTGSRSRWTEAERKKGQAWGLQTIKSFHTHGTPPVGE